MTRLTALNCPNCGAPLPDVSSRKVEHIVCAYCDHQSKIDGQQLGLVGHVSQTKPRDLPLQIGDTGELFEHEQTVIAVMRYRCQGETWLEYALYSPTVGYSYLSYDLAKKWTFSRRVRGVTQQKSHKMYEGAAYVPGESYTAVLEYVAGQLSWKASVGDEVEVEEYRRPYNAFSLIRERSEREIGWFLQQELPAYRVGSAFDIVLASGDGAGDDGDYTDEEIEAATQTMGCAIISFLVVLVLIFMLSDCSGGGSSSSGYYSSGGYRGGK